MDQLPLVDTADDHSKRLIVSSRLRASQPALSFTVSAPPQNDEVSAMSTHTDTADNQPAGSISGSAPYAIYSERASASLSVAQQVVDLVLHRLANGENIRVLGLTGPPGTGKTTVAALVAEILETADVAVAGIAPMDGFHMSNAVLDDLERHDRKGAPDTFDVWGYQTLLARIQASEHPVFAPDYNRGLHEPVAASILIPTEGIVITEGNYLAFDEPGWREARGHIDFLVHIDTPTDAVMRRLVTRHEAFGKCRADAAHWVRTVDAPNIELVAECASRADAIISPQTGE